MSFLIVVNTSKCLYYLGKLAYWLKVTNKYLEQNVSKIFESSNNPFPT